MLVLGPLQVVQPLVQALVPAEAPVGEMAQLLESARGLELEQVLVVQ